MDFPHAVRPNYPSPCTKGKNAVLSQLLLRWICLPLGKVSAPSPLHLPCLWNANVCLLVKKRTSQTRIGECRQKV